jgi:2-polyprenyl-6-hydroxyphenyl methylase/3-demethylubiquinone-9 3-methyltransferase
MRVDAMAAATARNARQAGAGRTSTAGARTIGPNTVDAEEIARFDRLAATWWDENGPMKPLHAMNPARLSFIREQALLHFGGDMRSLAPLAGLTAVDVGCGGGLLSEPLARMGADVTGLDPASGNIAIARQHAERAGLAIDYRDDTLEAAVARGERFDMVLALEVVEHVADVPAFLDALFAATKPGGLAVLSTLNRGLRSFAAAIVGAEYVMRWLPVGTHDWRKFIRPDELERALELAGFEVREVAGMVPDISAGLGGGFRLSRDTAVNYIVAATRRAD